MPVRRFRSILDECLTAVRQGESIEACISRYPRHEERLRPLLTLAQRVSQTPAAGPRPRAQEIAWDRVRQRAREPRRGRRFPSLSFPWLRPVALAASLVLALLAATGGVAYASQDSLPDGPLYRIKLATEDVRLWFAFDDTGRAEILLDQSDERTAEIVEMVQRGKAIPGNVLSALKDRNERAARIVEEQPPQSPLIERLLSQSEAQEELLLAVRQIVSTSAIDEYGEVVATLHNTRLGGSRSQVSLAPEDLSGGIITISGPVQPGSDGIWQVGGFEVRIDERTFGHADLIPGGMANLVVARGADGRLQALSLAAVEDSVPESGTLVSGAVEQILEDEIVVGGQRFIITSETLLQTKPQEGQRVQITANTGEAGVVASNVKAVETEDDPTSQPTLAYEGIIEGTASAAAYASEYIIGGITFTLTPTTVFDVRGGNIENGAWARVEAINHGERLLAERVIILASDAKAGSISIHLTGVYQGREGGYWLVSGLRVAPPAGRDAPARGSLVAIDAERQDDVIVALQSTILESTTKDRIARLEGLITEIDGDFWTVGVARIHVGESAHVFGQAKVGERALIWGQPGDGEVLEAAYIRVLDVRPIITSWLK